MSNDRPENSRPEEPDKGLDVDAAFADIIAHWVPDEASTWPDPEPTADDPGPEDDQGAGATGREGDRADAGLRRLFEPAWAPEPHRELEADDGQEEEHFVPPPPPPLPTLEPRRKAAWICLVATPVIALVLLVAGVAVPEWTTVGLVVSFVAGFGYLVATMGSSSPDDWPGDDGAVL